jgi:hypothetical protein
MTYRNRSSLHSLLLGAVACLSAAPALGEGVIDTLVQRFAASEFVFTRAQSNGPFPPPAALTANGYQDFTFRPADGADPEVTAEQQSVSQYALVPIPIGTRDAIVAGEWMSWTHFDLTNAARDDLEVFSVAIPVGWIRQASPDWQVAAFVSPLAHRTPDDDWYWETLGGIFTRNVRGDRLAWIIGAYFDVSPLEDFFTPYIGAVYIVNERWTLNGVMPWPSVTYAPNTDVLFRLGVSPSGASWSIEPGGRRPRVNLTAWNFGLAAERRLYQGFWIGFEIGTSCLRGLSIVGADWEPPETKLDNTGYALLTLNFRPGFKIRGR